MEEKFSFPGCNAGVRFQDLTRDLTSHQGPASGFRSQTRYESFCFIKAEIQPTRIGQETRGVSCVTNPHGHMQHSPRPAPALTGLCELRTVRRGRAITNSGTPSSSEGSFMQPWLPNLKTDPITTSMLIPICDYKPATAGPSPRMARRGPNRGSNIRSSRLLGGAPRFRQQQERLGICHSIQRVVTVVVLH
jgi:hypothetical protein